MGEHTPGPWETGAGNFGLIRTPGSVPKHIAHTRERDMADGEELANARLIAAAPDLLEACEEILAELGRTRTNEVQSDWDYITAGEFEEQVALLRAAVAKARGKEGE